ncbi:beta-N-acetylhexosaminidase [Saccharopolyspora erythraea NRRL 2338]|uniref:beta-N-acetylhexosaminidase n=1 Tax=Saccharopolyspora erythraea TaxID=1836 RepID=A0ABP3NJ41_SACER|nr:glycoside hydrolase family 3 protein [Saccharopolyspora erythraea]EQD87257.1 beta-N-acetylhexosaminidase [Saccharopolyspora erythraea D]PFG93515.1 beta-N-acetylhexosaminidase [Saccharopolyspora erythraea NRRL 2338]
MGRRSRLAAATISAVAVVSASLTAIGNAAPAGDAHSWATRTMRGMTLEEKVGQLFVTYAYGRTADTPHQANRDEFGVATPAEVVQKYHLGGIIHFNWTDSIYEPKQIAELSNGLQRAAVTSGAKIPLLISTDQEQGQITRIKEPATQLPGNMALGAGRSPADAERAAVITGQELRAMGLAQNFAPSGDVNVNPANPVIGVRSFSSDPALAAELTAAQVRGYQGYGAVTASVKHFPGHGDTNQDSHEELPVIEHDRQQWEALDAPPFRAAIDAGTDTVMSAHIVVPKLDDSGEPSTLSRNVLTGMLREELGFRGVVVTDSLQMEGVRHKHPDAEIPVLALEAGADQLLMPQHLQVAIDGVIGAVRSGRLTEKRIDQSVERILRMKAGRGVIDRPFVDVSKVDRIVGSPRNLEAAQKITDRTTTLLRNDAAVLPLRQPPGRVLVTGAGASPTKALAGSITARGSQATALETGMKPTPQQIDQAVQAAGQNDLTVVLTNAAWNEANASQRDLVRALQRSGKPVVAVAVRDPYDAAHVDEVPTWLTTYSDKAVAMESLARTLFGEIAPVGKLPVPVPDPTRPGTDRYPFGHGLSW